LLGRPHDYCRGLCARRCTAAPRPPVPRSGFDAMTILARSCQHPFAGESRRRARFIPAPASAGTASQASPPCACRVPQPWSVRTH
jgi:hypothetical protein